jgi:hypothetical protein
VYHNISASFTSCLLSVAFFSVPATFLDDNLDPYGDSGDDSNMSYGSNSSNSSTGDGEVYQTLTQTTEDLQQHVQQGAALLQNISGGNGMQASGDDDGMQVDALARVKQTLGEISAETVATGSEPFERLHLVPKSSLAAAATAAVDAPIGPYFNESFDDYDEL